MEFLRFRASRAHSAATFAAVTFFAIVSAAAQFSGDTSNPQDTQQPNCSDPTQAASAACASQLGRPSTINPSSPVSPVPEIPSFYSDRENLRQGIPGPLQRKTPPEPLTEFQQFVASSTGQILPIFGADLFRQVPSTFAPLDLTPVPSNYVVGPGDELRIRVWGQVTFQANVRVDRSGEVYLPRVGPVHVSGLAFSELQGQLQRAVGAQFKNFQLIVDLGQIRAIQVYTSGQARHPGLYTISGLSSLLDALFASGGPSVRGSLRRIELRRDGKLVSVFDLYSLLTAGDRSTDVKLQSGDVIFIPAVGPQVAVTGSVRSPSIYELKPGETLKDLLSDAGGASAVAAATRISVGRIADHRDLRTIDVSFDDAGLNTPLADGDLVHVYSIVPRFQQTVTLRGNLANPGKFSWHDGMRISDLIPDKESLLTRSYWWKRAQLGLPAPEFEPSDNLSLMRQPTEPYTLPPAGSRRPVAGSEQYGQNSLFPPGDPRNQANQQGYQQQYPQQGYQQDYQQGYPQGSQQDYGAQQQAQPGQDYPYQPGPFQRRETRIAQGSGLAEGSEDQDSNVQMVNGVPQRPRTEVRFLTPEIDWDYAVIERLNRDTLKTQIIPFDLGRLVLQHDDSQNLELQPGDVVTIFSEADIRLPVAQQSKLIKLEGEFAHAGAYSAQPGETLRQLVQRAGGLTDHAYLYGSEFRRESTRRLQQQRIDDYIRGLDMQMQRSSLAFAASASAQDVASGVSARSNQQDILSQLRQLRASGRIVLEFKPDSSGADGIPDIALENGDTFIVPSRPVNINVIGAVYDQNSFLFNPTRNVNEYLHLAGGPSRSADAKHAFIIRANGEVVAKEATSGVWSNPFPNLLLNPGDSIVVPEKVYKPSALKGVLDWSQVFSQFALGAASLSVLH
jgi:protein involved in polysaccharide export with SLBB domain